MHTNSDKKPKGKDSSVAVQSKNDAGKVKKTFQFVDERKSSLQLKNIQLMANSSSQIKQQQATTIPLC